MTPRMLLPLITLIMLQACSHIPSPRDLSFDLPERWFGAPAKLDDKKDEAQTQDPHYRWKKSFAAGGYTLMTKRSIT